MPFCLHGIDAQKIERIVEKIGQQGYKEGTESASGTCP